MRIAALLFLIGLAFAVTTPAFAEEIAEESAASGSEENPPVASEPPADEPEASEEEAEASGSEDIPDEADDSAE